MDSSNYTSSSILFHNYHDCSNCSPSSGLVIEFGLIDYVGQFSFPYDLYVNFACNSHGMIPNRNVSCYNVMNHLY